MDENFNEKSLPLPFQTSTGTFANVSSQLLRLQRLSNQPESREAVLVVSRSNKMTGFEEFRKFLYSSTSRPEHILILNNWFNSYTPNNRAKVYYAVWYIAPGALEDKVWRELFRRFPGVVVFYLTENDFTG